MGCWMKFVGGDSDTARKRKRTNMRIPLYTLKDFFSSNNVMFFATNYEKGSVASLYDMKQINVTKVLVMSFTFPNAL